MTQLVLLAGLFLFSQDPGDPLVDGKRALEAGDTLRAEELFRARTEQHPDDADAWFYLGHCQASRKAYAEAVPSYRRSIERGLDRYQSFYQMGYSAHRAGMHDVSEQAMLAALEHKPESAEALYHLGASRYRLGRYADADHDLSRLIARNTAWTVPARFHRGLSRHHLGRSAEAKADLDWVIANSKDEGLRARAAEVMAIEPQEDPDQGTPERDIAPRPVRKAEPKGWDVIIYEKAGHDSNVLRLPDSQLSSQSGEDDIFITSFLRGSVDVLPNKLLRARLSVLDISYMDLDENSTTALIGSLDSEAPLGRSTALLLSLKGETFDLDGEDWFDRISFRGGLETRLSKPVSLKLLGIVGKKDYDDIAFQELDADETGFLVELRHRKLLPGLEASIRLEQEEVDAEVGDRSYRGRRIALRFDVRISEVTELRVEGYRRTRDYDDPDRVALIIRDDTQTGHSAGLHFRIGDGARLFIEGEWQENDSNIDSFDYDRTQASIGLLLLL